MDITVLGEAKFPTPLSYHVGDKARVVSDIIIDPDNPPKVDGMSFELAGPRERLCFDPKKTRAGIVTCGGLCPGINNVIRSLVLQLHHGYGVYEILGFRDGYQGLDPWRGADPIPLSPTVVEDIHKEGGSILNTSRGPVDISVAVDNLIRRKIDILFVVGGDGTQRGGADIFQEAERRGHALAVVGVPFPPAWDAFWGSCDSPLGLEFWKFRSLLPWQRCTPLRKNKVRSRVRVCGWGAWILLLPKKC